MPWWDAEGNRIGFKEATKFQLKDPKGYVEAQKAGAAADRAQKKAAKMDASATEGAASAGFVATFRGIGLTQEGQVTSARGGGPVAGAQASVETSGAKAIASRRTMMRTVTPLAVLGQKKMESDTRRCFLTIEGSGWGITEEVSLAQEGAARAFAAKVNAAGRTAATTASTPETPPAIELPEQIEKLARLREQGILSAEEFAAKKAELLARM